MTLADTGHEAFLKSDFYHHIWKRSGHAAERMRTNVIMNADIQIGFGLSPYARSDEISSHMRKVYTALLPHMIRSVDLHWRMHRLELERSISIAGSDAGVMVVNSDGRILMADPLAEEILSRGAPLGVRKGVLSARYHADTASILGMIDSCVPRKSGYHLRGGSAEISYPDCPPLNIAIMPVAGDHAGFALDVDANAQPVAIVILEDLAMRRNAQVGRLCQTHGLTEREAEVALAALAGGSRLDIAENLGVSDATVRTHLSRIYEKLGVKRMGELVRFLQQDGFAG